MWPLLWALGVSLGAPQGSVCGDPPHVKVTFGASALPQTFNKYQKQMETYLLCRDTELTSLSESLDALKAEVSALRAAVTSLSESLDSLRGPTSGS